MSKRNLILSIIFGLTIILVGCIVSYFLVVSPTIDIDQKVEVRLGENPENTQYRIDGVLVTLVNGIATATSTSDNATMILTEYFGNVLSIDLNTDSREDTVFLLTQDDGQNGKFYYLAAAINTETGYVGSDAFLVGYRIEPQQTNLDEDGSIVVTFTTTADGELDTTKPTVAASVRLTFDADTNQFSLITDDSVDSREGILMGLWPKTWMWQETIFKDSVMVTPKEPDVFSLTFNNDGSFTATTDCNGVGGQFRVSESIITFSEILSTLMYCDGSQEADFIGYLSNASGYHFTTQSELVLDLNSDSGTVVFRQVSN